MSSSHRSSRKSTRSEYIETDSGNKVSRRALITGTPNITLAGKTVLMPDVLLRGDLVRSRPPPPLSAAATSTTSTMTTTTTTTTQDATKDAKDTTATGSTGSKEKPQTTTAISIGKYTIIATSTVLKPPSRQSRGIWTAYPLKIGDQVFIGPQCIVSAALIHSHVHIGARCVLMPFCVIRENVRILDDTVIPANMVVPPGSVVGGRPGRIVGEVGEGFGVDGAGEGWVEGGDLREVVRSIK